MNSGSVPLDIQPPTYDEVMNADRFPNSNHQNSGTLLENVDIKNNEETKEEKKNKLENTPITEQPFPSAPPPPTTVPVRPGVAPANNQRSAPPYVYGNDPGWEWLFWCFICHNYSQTQPLNNAHEGCCTSSDDQCCCGDDCGCGDCCAAFGHFDCDF